LKGKKNADAAVVVPFIPKRGDKDFEPIESLAAAQQNALKKSRNAMFAALQAGDSRQHQSKVHNEAVWHPDIARGSMKSTSGIHFQTMGHFHPARRRVELFPEEMLYLLERGTLECWTEEGVPMSAQQGFAWMLGQDELTMERYQVSLLAFALRR
jgi:tRNA-splicing endonuclease subunit Sen54